MKKLLLAAAIIITAASVQAQTNFSIAGNIGVGTYSGSTLVAGGDIQVDFPATTGLKITASAGYENYGFKFTVGSTTVKGHTSFIPLLAGAKFNLSTNLYGHAQLGYSINTASGGGGAFTYAPSLGYMVSPNFDIAVKYIGLSNNGSTMGGVVARFAYTLGK